MNIREMDELYTKFLVVTGLPAEKILDLFLAGYTLVSPAPPICLEVLAEGFDIEREYTRLKNEMQAVKAENRRWGQVCEAQNKRIGQLEKERDEAEREAAQYKAFFDGVANKPDCNTCADKGCKHRPKPGEIARFNCPLYRGKAAEE